MSLHFSSHIYVSLIGFSIMLSGCGLQSSIPVDERSPQTEAFLPAEAILPYDSSDATILLRAPLTSPESITANGGYEEPTSANSYHPEFGMRPAALSSGVPGCRFTAETIPALANLPEGQLSIEVERAWLSVEEPDSRSTGASHSASEYLISYGSGGKPTAGKVFMDINQNLVWLFRAGEDSRLSKVVNSKLSPMYARITISWTQTEAELFVDGLRMGSLPRQTAEVADFSQLFLGSFVGSTESPFAGNFYIRNLLVASKPVLFSTPPLLDHVMLIGDSFAAGQPFSNIATRYDGTIANTILRNLAADHFAPRRFGVYSNGGGKIQDLSNDPLELDVNGSGLPRDDVLREDPSVVIFVTGGNDIGIFDSQVFTTDLRDHVEAFLGANGHHPTTTQKVIVTTTVTSGSNASQTVHAMRDIMRALPSWWDASYPQRAGDVQVVDAWSMFGGDSVDTELFMANDPIHPAPAGNLVYGEAITSKLLELTTAGVAVGH
jgi:hypothetical protein